MTYKWIVRIDGAEATPITLSGGTITYGRSSIHEQPSPISAYFTILTPDAIASIADDFPEFAAGPYAAASGFTRDYSDTYKGASSRLRVGASITVSADTVSGFTAGYSDTYAGEDMTRFTGRIGALDYAPGEIGITGVSTGEALTRAVLYGWQRPAETDLERVAAIAKASGVEIAITGTKARALIADDQSDDVTAWEALHAIAADCLALVYTDRHGVLHYVTRESQYGDAITIPGEMILTDGLAMSQELGSVVNRVKVEWGPVNTVDKSRSVYTQTDAVSVKEYGYFDKSAAPALRDKADAIALANALMSQEAVPNWNVPNATVILSGVPDELASPVAGADLQDVITLGPMPKGSPFKTYTALLLGYTETISQTMWQLALNLSPDEYAGAKQ